LALIQQEERVQQQKREEDEEQNEDPLAFFMYALKAPETKRQWLKIFLDFKVGRCHIAGRRVPTFSKNRNNYYNNNCNISKIYSKKCNNRCYSY
jgi:hypothetical protein